MKIYFDQIPEGYECSDYPEGTEFVLDDTPVKRDPISFQIVKPQKRPLVYPDDIKNEY